MTTFDVKITLLSPLHIGSGEELRADFDFITYKGRTLRLNVDAILQDFEERFQPDRFGKYPTPGAILRTSDGINNPKYLRYLIHGLPRSSKSDARVQECIKDVYDNPYLPGSSFKGALRTALAWTGWSERDIKLSSTSFTRRKYWAGEKIEKALFGPTPNADLLRALQVGDCFSKNARDKLVVANAQVLTKRDAGSPIELEAIAGDVVFSGQIKIDEFLFSAQAERKLHFSDRAHWLKELLLRVQQHSHARIEALLSWFNSIDDGSQVVNFLDQLYQFEPDPHQALIQLGWGTGWDGKTFWTHLKQDEVLFEKLLKDYRMVKQGKRQPGDVFPKSRRAVMQAKDETIKPLAPFGWALIEFTKPE